MVASQIGVQDDATFEGRQSFFNLHFNGLRLFTYPPPFYCQGVSPVARSSAIDMEDSSYSTPWISRRSAGYPRSATFNPTFELLRKHTLHAGFEPAQAGRVPGITERYLNLSAAIEPVTETSKKPARRISQRPDCSKASHHRLRRSGRLSVNTSRCAGTTTGGPASSIGQRRSLLEPSQHKIRRRKRQSSTHISRRAGDFELGAGSKINEKADLPETFQHDLRRSRSSPSAPVNIPRSRSVSGVGTESRISQKASNLERHGLRRSRSLPPAQISRHRGTSEGGLESGINQEPSHSEAFRHEVRLSRSSSSTDISERTAVSELASSASDEGVAYGHDSTQHLTTSLGAAPREGAPEFLHEQAAHVQESLNHRPVKGYLHKWLSGMILDPGSSSGHSSSKPHYEQLEQEIYGLERHLEFKQRNIHRLQQRIKILEEENGNLLARQEAHNREIRKAQEHDFKQMGSGRWLPQEESKVEGDFIRLKRDMKAWAKDAAIEDISLLDAVHGTDRVDLGKNLAKIVCMENGRLPHALNASKTPSKIAALLLNGLLAHHVYKTILNPFFFFNDGLGTGPRREPHILLQNLYQSMQRSHEREAHIWRSDMLRLLRPPLREDSDDTDTELNHTTNALIADVSRKQAREFLAGPARHLIESEAKESIHRKINAVYAQAAELSYQVWTRRTTIRFFTLQDMNGPDFNIDSPYMEPHTMVRWDRHEDQLFGHPILVVVHPVVEAYGTDEAEDYDRGRVWAKAVVWLES